jgi:hypothetical protein
VRITIDTLTGDVNEKATADKEAGHSASAPSVLEGYKKLDRTFCAHHGDFCIAEQQPAAAIATIVIR